MVREKEGCRFPDTPKDRLAEKVFNDSWSTERVASLATLTKTHRDGYNLGVRLGEPSFFNDLYLHCIDLDIRDPDKADEAWGALLELIPKARSLPSVISGSMGEPPPVFADRSTIPVEKAAPLHRKNYRKRQEGALGLGNRALRHRQAGRRAALDPSRHRQALQMGAGMARGSRRARCRSGHSRVTGRRLGATE